MDGLQCTISSIYIFYYLNNALYFKICQLSYCCLILALFLNGGQRSITRTENIWHCKMKNSGSGLSSTTVLHNFISVCFFVIFLLLLQ